MREPTDRQTGPLSRPRLPSDERGVAPVVGKVLEVGLVMLFVGAVTAALYGGVVPDYRTAAGDEVADRVVASGSQQVQAAVPPNSTDVRSVTAVDVPETIRGETYDVVVRNRTLVLDHPDPGVSAESRLALPDSVVNVSGSWSSNERAWVVVESVPGGLAVRLEGGERP
ncbi:hypothetical protein BRC81_11865 [Halobacteriales archaeon QS_1_68_20]|nr:MAG: hypothetical protein BRC81_11865 [Halobacteriales archaeon QS_1_68_20]